jgi:predicted DCC family thiol-disulfide oxidoreductase YuxK
MKTSTQVDWVLYDDGCGICRKWVPFWRKTLVQNGFEIAPLQSKWVADRLHLSDEELMRDIRLLLKDGSEISGADAYRYVMRRIWWAYPFYLLSISPILRKIFDVTYRTFARNRYRISNTCKL